MRSNYCLRDSSHTWYYPAQYFARLLIAIIVQLSCHVRTSELHFTLLLFYIILLYSVIVKINIVYWNLHV